MRRLLVFAILWHLQINAVFCQNEYFEYLKTQEEQSENPKGYLYNLLDTENSFYKRSVIYNRLGLRYQYSGDIDSAYYCHQSALQNAVKIDDSNQEIGISLNKIGIVHYYKGQVDSAILFFDRALPYFSDSSLKASGHNNLAMMHKANSNPDLSIDNYLKALDIYEGLNETKKQIIVLGNIGALYNDLKDYDNSKKYLDRGLVLAKNTNDYENEMFLKSNLGLVYLHNGQLDEAVKIFIEVNDYYAKTNDIIKIISVRNNLAACYDELGQYQKSLDLYLSLYELMQDNQIQTNKEAILLNISSAYLNVGKPQKSLEYAHKGLYQIKVNGINYLFENAYKQLAEVHNVLDNKDSALFYKDIQIQLRDSLEKVEKEKLALELEAKYESDKLNEDLNETVNVLKDTQKQKEKFSTGLMYSLIFSVLAVLIGFGIFKRYQRKKELAEQLAVENEKGLANISELENSLKFKQEKGKLPYPKHLEDLTDREKEVLLGVQDGLKDKEIADRLFISITTVRTHLRKAYVKIDVRNRAEAIKFISEYQI